MQLHIEQHSTLLGHSRALFAGLFLAGAATIAQAQDTPLDGFATNLDAYPGAGLTSTFDNGDILSFDGSVVSRYDEGGSLIADLFTLPAFAFGSFLILAPDETFALLGESSTDMIYSIDVVNGGGAALTSLHFNFDAAFEDLGHAIVSAATCGFGCGNEIYRVDTVTGTTDLIALVGGSSGPVAVEADGDLLYGRVSDTFSLGDYRVLRFDAADLTGTPVAAESDATVVGLGFDGASDLAIDPVDGGIYLAENDFTSGLNRIRWVRGDAALSPILLDGANGLTIGNLEFEAGDAEALFRAYQPERGGLLRYNSTDFFATFERKGLVPARPVLSLSGPGSTGAGALTVTIAGGAPNGFAGVLYGPTALFDPAETALSLAALEAPLFLGLDLFSLTLDSNVIALDATGTGVLSLPHDGSLLGLVTAQALVLDPGFGLVQISTAASL